MILSSVNRLITSHSKGQKTVGRARASLILANNFLPLNEALGGTTFRFLFLTNFRVFNFGLVVILFRGFSPKRFVIVANHCRESSNNICVVR